MAEGAGAHVAGLSERGSGSVERPKGDLPGQRTATSPGPTGISAAK